MELTPSKNPATAICKHRNLLCCNLCVILRSFGDTVPSIVLLMVICSEMFVDWMTRAFITKFNDI